MLESSPIGANILAMKIAELLRSPLYEPYPKLPRE